MIYAYKKLRRVRIAKSSVILMRDRCPVRRNLSNTVMDIDLPCFKRRVFGVSFSLKGFPGLISEILTEKFSQKGLISPRWPRNRGYL